MWELPAADGAGAAAMKLRHAITNTDYLVTIVCAPAPKEVSGRWVHFRRLRQLPLTGLARKVLRKAGIKF
jgi:A/G-specific adenine glycosylase